MMISINDDDDYDHYDEDDDDDDVSFHSFAFVTAYLHDRQATVK